MIPAVVYGGAPSGSRLRRWIWLVMKFAHTLLDQQWEPWEDIYIPCAPLSNEFG